MRAEPARIEIERRRERENVRCLGFEKMRQAGAAGEPRAAVVDLVHEIERLDRRLEGRGEADRRSVVDTDIDAAEGIDHRGHRAFDLLREADIALQGQRFAARPPQLFSRRMDRARQLRVRRHRFCGNRYARPIARRAQPDGKPDAAAAAGDENDFAL